MLEEILENFDDEELLMADGFDSAVIGIDEHSLRLIYSVRICLEILTEDMTMEDALEYFSYNVSGAYVGEKTPIWCVDTY
jgi:hypothetical protein